jgi:hypothetical protein
MITREEVNRILKEIHKDSDIEVTVSENSIEVIRIVCEHMKEEILAEVREMLDKR